MSCGRESDFQSYYLIIFKCLVFSKNYNEYKEIEKICQQKPSLRKLRHWTKKKKTLNKLS